MSALILRRFVVSSLTFALLLASGCERSPSTASNPDGAAPKRWRGSAASCQSLAPTCGPSGDEDCCTSLRVPGGTFARTYDAVDYLDAKFSATVSDFYLDRYEITLGRFRKFVSSGLGTQASPPAEGSGAHPRIPGSGWKSAWNSALPMNAAEVTGSLKCHDAYQTWTDAVGDHETLPLNCVDWHTAFVFCAWDGGRLPTEAEWNYAAAAGREQRYYPWSVPPQSTVIDDSYAAYCGGTCKILNVGSKSPKGDGKWGQADLGGNVWEWTLDLSDGTYPMPCHDCAELNTGSYRAFRSGSNDDIAATLRTAVRHIYYPDYRGVVGVRCARDP